LSTGFFLVAPKGLPPVWPPQEEFADRLSRLRRARPLSNQEIADACGINPNTVSNWRGGQKPEGMVLLKLAALFDVTPEWLLTGEVAKPRATVPNKPIAVHTEDFVEPGVKRPAAKRKGRNRA
jgi:transcriptional regulator with XRE-family HTH domain